MGSRADKVLSPAWQSLRQLMPREISVVRSSTLVCGAQLSQQWFGACLSYTLRVVDSTLLGLLISVWAPLMASREFPWEPLCGWSCFTDTAVLVTCADILGVSPCQMCLAWLRLFLSWTKVSWLTGSHLDWHEWLHFVLYTLCYLDWTNAILLVLFSIGRKGGRKEWRKAIDCYVVLRTFQQGQREFLS